MNTDRTTDDTCRAPNLILYGFCGCGHHMLGHRQVPYGSRAVCDICVILAELREANA